ncbi:hypothetical protein A6U87_06665 [Rhizobium sp. AC44/96]|uniref:DUF2934 domain-containing protein n=1 Tax=Rhizobium sp. AC44/96 TaxID=1841654 RepID=UPI00080F8673|nr:DUF2934 domain-containing protein [Rhizobium sp. AC44/96]OCJ12977.1 hypothetical protein A6U87_06665 [Rhizobium sp. AC44/96]
MFRSKDDWINQRAYAIWEAAGRPQGHGSEHWQQAAREYEMLEKTRASVDGSELIERLKTMGRLMRAADEQSAPSSKTTKRSSMR